jgi:hypothetical protein
MHKIILAVLVAVTLLCLLPVLALAGFVVPLPTFCFDGAEGRKMINDTGKLTAQGIMGESLLTQLRVKPDGSFAVVLLTPQGRVCIAAIGTDWTDEPKTTY